jgi:hypothetical protein
LPFGSERLEKTMMTTKTTSFPALLAASMLALGMGQAQADTVVVICHPSVTLSAAEIKDVFLGEKQLAGVTKLIPVDNNSLEEVFLGKIVRMDPAKYSGHWTKKSFRDGLTAPPVKGSDAEVLEFVKRTPGAVGYVKTAGTGVTTVTQQ